jgi:SAM-dependent methyltransferase
MDPEGSVQTRWRSRGADVNPNPRFYEHIAGIYDLLYVQVDSEEAVRQWLPIVRRFSGLPDPGQRVRARLLDLGCGTGRYLGPWAAAGFDVTGVDVSKRMIARARRRRIGSECRDRIHLFHSDLRRPDPRLEGRGPFDAAVAHFNFLNLFPPGELQRVLASVRRYLPTGGRIFADCATPAEMPEEGLERTVLSNGVTIEISTDPDPGSKTVSMRYLLDGQWFRETYWLHSAASLRSVAQTAGWRIEATLCWRPDRADSPWGAPARGRGHRFFVFKAI